MDRSRELAVMGDPARIRAVFENGLEVFRSGRLQLAGVRIRRFKLRADGTCLLQYDVDVTHPEGGESERQVWVGDIATGDPPRSSDLDRTHTSAPSVHRLRDPELLLWVFPHDPVLHGLGTLCDPARMRDLLEHHREAFHFPAGARIESVETEAIKYVGTERCTLRHEIALDDGARRIVFSKITNDPIAAAASFAAMQAFYRGLRSEAIATPEAFLFDADLNTVFTEGLAGANVDERIDELDLERTGSDIGAALAALHRCEVDALPALRGDELVRRLPRVEATLGKFGDETLGRVRAVCAELTARAPDPVALPARPVHGAFRLSQLLALEEPGRYALIDFDSCARGDPLFDLGSFAAYLVYLVEREELAAERAGACIRSFRAGYERSAPWPIPPERLRWHVAAQLVTKHARRSGARRARKKDKDERARARQKQKDVALANRLLDTARAVLSGERADLGVP